MTVEEPAIFFPFSHPNRGGQESRFLKRSEIFGPFPERLFQNHLIGGVAIDE